MKICGWCLDFENCFETTRELARKSQLNNKDAEMCDGYNPKPSVVPSDEV